MIYLMMIFTLTMYYHVRRLMTIKASQISLLESRFFLLSFFSLAFFFSLALFVEANRLMKHFINQLSIFMLSIYISHTERMMVCMLLYCQWVYACF